MMTTIWKYDRNGMATKCEDEVTEERALTIYVNGTRAVRLASSGDLVDAAAVGHAVSEGWARPAQVLAVTVEERSAFLTVSSDAAGPGAPTSVDIDCISGDILTEDMAVSPGFTVSASWIQDLAEEMQRSALHWRNTGGVHAALVAQGEHVFCCEDISRHTALDKVIGHALMHSWNLREAVLMGTGRIPAQAVAQAARVGIPVLASRSATTAQAIALAERVGTTVVAFVRAGRLNVYSHPERVVP
ncbi:MAG: formate dehydrogenase accessory sulfurtransferase FdhD [Caldiserica bacterium]|nr:formate dehydrogenase accessory sulfurtransferase FdhD [Caldisericota bacterium]